jgi:glycolate oxidase FAD binding subunit
VACVAGGSRERGAVTAIAGDVQGVAERIREAYESRTALRLAGAGHWLDAGAPCAATETLRLGALAGIVEYEPGDLTLTARAGTTLAELARITAAEKQWLPLEPFGAPSGTLGATVATASCGPLAAAFGTPRDQVLGCELVTGEGAIVRAGGRVVKNVAGFDITRLMIGAWGTLGALTEISVRLRAMPEVDRTLALEVAAEASWRWLRETPFTPLAAELVSPTLAAALGLGTETVLLLRIGGNPALVRAASASARTVGEVRELDGSVWATLAASEPRTAAVVRLSARPSRAAALWERASMIVERIGGYVHSTLQRGVVRCVIPYDDAAGAEEQARLRGVIGVLRLDDTCVVERLPPALWSSLVHPTASDALSARVRDAFDPRQVLNPGILG